jgi:cell division protein FtsA
MNIKKSSTPTLAGLDIGSSKVAVTIGTLNAESKIEIVGVGQSPNYGIRQGVVVNIEATAEAIRKAREEAELMSGFRIDEVWMSVSGSHIKSFDSKGMVAVRDKREINSHDVERVIDAAKAVAVPVDRKVLHVIPREFKVDGQDGILDPVGMSGIRLEANVHIVTGSQTAISNNLKCLDKAGLKSVGMVLDPLASAMSVLSEDEKSLGVCVADIGAGACNLVYFINGSVAHTSILPIGGQHFTHDIAIGLRTPQIAAEELKKQFGCAMASLISTDEMIEVEGVGGRKSRTVLRKDLAEVIEPRAEETLQLIAHDIKMSGLMPLLGSGVILTGGASQLSGFIEMGEFILDIPVRRGAPNHVSGLSEVVRSASFSTSVGLLQYGLAQKKFTRATKLSEESLAESINSVGTKIRGFFENLF